MQDNEFPGHPPGLVGEIAKLTATRLTYELPNIALATALSAVSRMISNHMVVVAPTGRETPLNLYTLVTANSGTGKESCRSILNEIGKAVAGDNLISSNPASPQALGRMLSVGSRTSLLLFQDEYGKKLAHANSGSGAHEAAVNAMLLELFPLGLGTYSGRAYAKEKEDVKPAEQPYVCLLAATTTEPLADALQDTAVFDGTLNRFVYLPQPDKLKRNEGQSFEKIQQPVIDQCKMLWMGEYPEDKLGKKIQIHQSPNATKDDGRFYLPIEMSAEAHRFIDEFDRSLDPVKEAGGVRAALAARATELAIRVAGVVAVGCADKLDEITLNLSDARYGVSLVQYSMSQMLSFVDDQLISTNTNRLPERILEFCNQCIRDPQSIKIPKDREPLRGYLTEGWIPQTLITLKFKNGIKKQDRNDALDTLLEAGDLEIEDREVGNQKAHFYRPRSLEIGT